MTKYTFTFNQPDEQKFRNVLSRLDDSEYTIIEDIHASDPESPKFGERKTIIDMDSECCLTFRMAMGNAVKIRRERTEAELAEEKELEEKNKITIKVIVPGGSTT